MPEWIDPNRMEMTEGIEVDALWRLKPTALMEKLISGCFQAAMEEENRRDALVTNANKGEPRTGSGQMFWPATKRKGSHQSETSSTGGLTWEHYRAGRSLEEGASDYNVRCGSPQSRLNSVVKPLVGKDKSKFFLETLAPGAKTGYWCAWNQWIDFASERGHSCWLNPDSGEDWDSNLIEFLLFHQHVMQRKAGTLRTKVAAARYFHLIRGKSDFTACGTRVKTLLRGIDKREAPNAKRPFNLELLEWMMRDARESLAGPGTDEKETIFAAAVLGFYFLLRVSEIAQVRRSDITVESTGKGRRIILVIRRSKTDQAGQGVTRALLETKTEICPVATMENSCRNGRGKRTNLRSVTP